MIIIRQDVGEHFENRFKLADDEWRLGEQVAALEAWLEAHLGDLDPQASWVADIGFSPREDACGGGPVLSRRLMEMCVSANLEIALSEYS